MTKTEKQTEKLILSRLQASGVRAEKIHSGSITIARGEHARRRIKLADKGTPDIIACVDGTFVAVEVKKNDAKVQQRKKLEQRHNNGEQLPKSYHREKSQIEHKNMIEQAGGIYIIACTLGAVMKQMKERFPVRQRKR